MRWQEKKKKKKTKHIIKFVEEKLTKCVLGKFKTDMNAQILGDIFKFISKCVIKNKLKANSEQSLHSFNTRILTVFKIF